MDWQPIETAPKDGTVIVVARFDDDEFVSRAWWQPEFDAWIVGARQIVMAPGYTIDGQTTKLHSPEIVRPTHWQKYDPPQT